MTESEEGMKYLLNVTDSFSNYIWMFPIKEQKSEVIAEKLLHVLSQIGIPDRVISDLGTPFVSKVMEGVWKLLGVEQITTAPYNQKANSRIERKHRVIGDNLRSLMQDKDEKTWDKMVVLVEWAMRSSESSVSPYSPNEILCGEPCRGPVQTFVEKFPTIEAMDLPEYVKN